MARASPARYSASSRDTLNAMSSAIGTLTESRSADAGAARVARGRFVEFLCVGGAGLVLFPMLWLMRATLGIDTAELAVGFLFFHAAHVINDPHFAVTYLLFYRNARARAFGTEFSAAQRVRYWFSGLIVPLALAVWVAQALVSSSARSLGWLIQAMFLLVGWHYVKQGFGVLTVLSARRGIRFGTWERRAFLAHCFTGWAYAWASPAAPVTESEEKGVLYFAIAHPLWLERITFVLFVTSTLALGFTLLKKWRREGPLPLAPITGFLVSIWLWSVYSSADPLMVYAIPALHSLQYLYFVGLLGKNRANAEARPFGPSPLRSVVVLAVSAIALGWLFFHGAPDLFDAMRLTAHRRAHERLGDLGPTPYFAAFFAFVNIHHYFMDNVIWRRENPETRYLTQ